MMYTAGIIPILAELLVYKDPVVMASLLPLLNILLANQTIQAQIAEKEPEEFLFAIKFLQYGDISLVQQIVTILAGFCQKKITITILITGLHHEDPMLFSSIMQLLSRLANDTEHRNYMQSCFEQYWSTTHSKQNQTLKYFNFNLMLSNLLVETIQIHEEIPYTKHLTGFYLLFQAKEQLLKSGDIPAFHSACHNAVMDLKPFINRSIYAFFTGNPLAQHFNHIEQRLHRLGQAYAM